VWVLREVGVVRHGVGLPRVVEIVTSGVSELRGDGRDDRRGGSLFNGLVGKDAGGFGSVERLPLLGREVSLQSGCDTAGVDRIGDDAVGGPPAGCFDCEEGVRGLGLGVGDLWVVAAALEVESSKSMPERMCAVELSETIRAPCRSDAPSAKAS